MHAEFCDITTGRTTRHCTCHELVGTEYGPYLAANGHRMMADIRAVDVLDDNRPIYNSWSAWCADNCGACSEGYDLPDWWKETEIAAYDVNIYLRRTDGVEVKISYAKNRSAAVAISAAASAIADRDDDLTSDDEYSVITANAFLRVEVVPSEI